jgi:Fur family peroxide stress response transcriptional regulator
MKTKNLSIAQDPLDESLATRGMRSTRQRHQVYDVLLQKRDHPTAEELFLRAKKTMPDISYATVYNCLDALVECGIVRQVHHHRSPTRFCPNMHEHGHFHCEVCGGVTDLQFPKNEAICDLPIPEGYRPEKFEVSIHGICAACAKRKTKSDSIQKSKSTPSLPSRL